MLLYLTSHFLKLGPLVTFAFSLKLDAPLQVFSLLYLVQPHTVCLPDYPVCIEFKGLSDLPKLVWVQG